jgi:hypothetical protein
MSSTYEPFKWAPPAVRERADAERQEMQQRLADAERKRAADFEQQLHDRYLQTGAGEEDWARDRAAIISDARKAAALNGEDVARSANRARYG